MLKVNTALIELDMSGVCLHVYCYVSHSVRLNGCVCCYVGNRIGDDGIRDIAEALKVNSTLVDIDLQCEWNIACVFFYHSPLTHS